MSDFEIGSSVPMELLQEQHRGRREWQESVVEVGGSLLWIFSLPQSTCFQWVVILGKAEPLVKSRDNNTQGWLVMQKQSDFREEWWSCDQVVRTSVGRWTQTKTKEPNGADGGAPLKEELWPASYRALSFFKSSVIHLEWTHTRNDKDQCYWL